MTFSLVIAGLMLIIANASGTFLGLLICSYLGLGFGFEDLKWEVVKCFVLAGIIVLLAVGLLSFFPHPGVLAAPAVVWFVVIKLCWLDLEPAEIAIVGVTSFFATAIGAQIALCLL